MSYRRPKIVIIGAGFAGLRAVRNLAGVEADILLIDRNKYHTFVPLLYQVATGWIPPQTVAYPIHKYLRSGGNARFLQAEVLGIDFEQKIVTSDRENISYDYLVMATGSQTKFLGVDGAPKYTYPLRTFNHALALRDRLLTNFQTATRTTGVKQQELLTVAIVGGGATGVELAGSISELAQAVFAHRDPQQEPIQVKIILIHSRARLLADFPDHLGNYTARQLRRRGVKVYLETRVSSVMPAAVELNDGTVIKTAAIIWTAGVEANLPTEAEQLPTAKSKKVCVRPTLQTLAYLEVYAIGDVAFVKQDGEPLLGIAPEAIQQGTAVAGNLKRQLQGRSPQAFNYFNKGTAAIIARNAGVAYLFGKIPLQGWFAWLMWLGIHLYYLPGLNNRATVFKCWIKDYFGGARKFTRVPAQATVKQLFSNHSQS